VRFELLMIVLSALSIVLLIPSVEAGAAGPEGISRYRETCSSPSSVSSLSILSSFGGSSIQIIVRFHVSSGVRTGNSSNFNGFDSLLSGIFHNCFGTSDLSHNCVIFFVVEHFMLLGIIEGLVMLQCTLANREVI
jgi:hypothetical protein